MKPVIKLSIKENILNPGCKGSFGHQPVLGDTKEELFYLNDTFIFTKVHGKDINKYSGNYTSYTKIDYSSEVIKQKIKSILEEFEISNNIKISKDLNSVVDKIYSFINKNSSSLIIRKYKDFLGCKVERI